jgi:hypothetical protein
MTRIQPAPLVFALTVRQGPLDPEVLFDLVIQACFNGDGDGPDVQTSTLVESLVDSYCAALVAADEEEEGRSCDELVPCFTDRLVAEREFNAVYLSVYNLDEPCGWPDVLPYAAISQHNPFPKRVVHVLAQAMAQRDNARLRAFQEYVEANPPQANL